MKKHDVAPRHLPRAQELVWAGLGGPIRFADVELPRGIASTHAIVREMEFLYPLPGAQEDSGFIKGYIDLVFEHRGKIYLVDWKSDLLPSYAEDALEVHCEHNYGMQARLYTTALVKMLGIKTRAEYDRTFGGTLYVFLRAMPQAGVRFARLAHHEVEK
jgi:exodeoxyribonuclease V beta subunit